MTFNRQNGEVIPQAGSTRGRLLVAAPPLEDPNFDRSVVYMLEHTDEGAIGVVLNRPLPDVAVSEVEGLDDWSHYVSEPGVVFAGGPVELNALIGLARLEGEQAMGWAAVTADVATVDLGMNPADLNARVFEVRIFSGYSGWGAGQLDGELSVGAWIVLDAEMADVFGPTEEALWRSVLRRQGGRLAWIADAPDDLSMN